jgi:hypothetical protein
LLHKKPYSTLRRHMNSRLLHGILKCQPRFVGEIYGVKYPFVVE